MPLQNELSHPLPSLWGNASPALRTARHWEYVRKSEILEVFSSQVYGRTPEGGCLAGAALLSRNEVALDGLATMEQWRLTLSGPRGSKQVALLLYTPSQATEAAPAPVFVGLNFRGNHSTSADPSIEMGLGYSRMASTWDDSPAPRADQASYWPVEIALRRGYAVATMHCADIEKDAPGYAAEGVRGLFHSEGELAVLGPDMWGTVGAWAWGLSRILDFLMTQPKLDPTRVIAQGHSRLGKTALWAAAQDPRFAAVISHASGCCGAGLFRHPESETIALITKNFPHWFAKNLTSYAGDAVASLAIDQHHLLAMVLPRPVHVCSTTEDAFRREFLGTVYASPIAELYGYRGTRPAPADLTTRGADLTWQDGVQVPTPEPGLRVGGQLSFHLRDGLHEVTAEDWAHFTTFADETLAL